MRRVLVIAALSTLALGVSAQAETWKGYSAVSATNVQWSYDVDYSYRDTVSKRVVVMTAVGKVGATPRMGPSAPGATDGVGQIWALDCKASNTLLVGSYSPSKPLAIAANWRGAAPKKIDSADDKALLKAACTDSAKLAIK